MTYDVETNNVKFFKHYEKAEHEKSVTFKWDLAETTKSKFLL